MSIRTASILISLLAHGTAYLYLGDFISLDSQSLNETGRGMKIVLVRPEKSPESVLPATSIAASEPEVPATAFTPRPPEERVLEAEQLTLSDELTPSSDSMVEQINKLPSTAAGTPIKVASKRPEPMRKQLPVKPQIVRESDIKPTINEPLKSEVHASAASSLGRVSARTEVTMDNADIQNLDHLLAIEEAYAQALVAAIEKHKRYPLRARKKGQEGEVKVLFTILEDGTISQVQVGESSLSSILDRAAFRAVETLGRFQPIPEQLGRKRWEFKVPVRFAMN